MTEENPHRLPRTVLPRRYRLEFRPDLVGGGFTGTAEIDIEVRQTTDELLLNAADLVILRASLLGSNQKAVTAEVHLIPERERVALRTTSALAPGSYTLALAFSGRFADKLRGFYLVTGKAADQSPTQIAVTQCFPTDARRVFPCWDEPDFKATFAVTVVVDNGFTALSNGPQLSQEPLPGGRRRVTFAETMPMSTYLVALVVGPMDLTAPRLTAGGIPVRVATPPGRSRLGAVAEDAAVRSLEFLSDYFGIPCPCPKMDHVAVPDFAAGAMENLGCVTYRNEALLVDPDRSSALERRRITSTVAHETSHMWFGDLVTMRWWNGSWLNEAFATLMAQMTLDVIHPEWDVWTSFAVGKNSALVVDALESTRPIDFPVIDPAEAWGMFDIITYTKGAAVLRMLEQHLGPEVFRRGISLYLTQHRHNNADTQDLWAALAEASGEPVSRVADSWVAQGGFPLVLATLEPGGRSLALSQSRFRYDGTPDPSAWEIPITIGIHQSGGTNTTIRLVLGRDPVALSLPDDFEWVLVNEQAWGFYRVSYDAELWSRLVGAWRSLSPRERIAVTEDAWAAVQAGRTPVDRVLALWRVLGEERNPYVWQAAIQGMTLLDGVAGNVDRYALEPFLREIAAPVLDELTWTPADGEKAETGQLRAALVRLLGVTLDTASVRATAHTMHAAHLAGDAPIAPELLSAVVEAAAAGGDRGDWEMYRRRVRDAATPQEEARYRQALAEFRDPALVQETVNYYLSPEVSLQNRAGALGHALARAHSAEAAWHLIEERWDDIMSTLPTSSIGRLLGPIAGIVDARLADRIGRWLDTHPVPASERRQVDQARELQAINRRLAERVRGHLAAAVDEKKL